MSQIKTECGNCVFFNYYDGPLCSFDRIEKFEKRGEVLYSETFQPVIQRLCNTCRNTETIKKVYGEDLDFDDILDLVRQSVVPSVDYIVLVDKNNFQDLDKTLESLKQFDTVHSIGNIIFGIVGDNLRAIDVYKKTRTLLEVYRNDQINIVSLFKKSAEQLEVLDECFKQTKSIYVSLFHAGYEIPSDLVTQLDEIMNDELIPLVLIQNADSSINGTTICRSIFNHFGSYALMNEQDEIKTIVQITEEELRRQNKEILTWNQK